MARKVYCKNTTCKHYCGKDGCDTIVRIGYDGSCESFEKGFIYYFSIVWDALYKKNYIDLVELNNNPDLRIGLYYVMDCYGLGFSEMEWGTCRILQLKDGENGKALTYSEIVEREIDDEKFGKHLTDFCSGVMPGAKEKQPRHKCEAKEFGWLSPSGEFTESPFGEHEESAYTICKEKSYMAEYKSWKKEKLDQGLDTLVRDFLSDVKGYCLIHNPTGYGGYIVTNTKNLTKKQREFLYGYFMDMGDRFKAEAFIDNE